MPALNPPTDPAAQLQWLVDREAVLDLVSNFAVSIDTKDQQSYIDNFTEDAVLTLPFGHFEGKDAIRAMPSPPPTTESQHLIGFPKIEIHGDTATARVPVQPTHVFDLEDRSKNASAGVYYDYEAVRTPEGWRLRRAKINMVWTGGEMIPGRRND